MSMMKRNKGEKKPFAFYLIIAMVIAVSILFVIWLPVPEPYATPLKTLLAMVLIIALSLLGIYIYTKQLRKGR